MAFPPSPTTTPKSKSSCYRADRFGLPKALSTDIIDARNPALIGPRGELRMSAFSQGQRSLLKLNSCSELSEKGVIALHHALLAVPVILYCGLRELALMYTRSPLALK